MAPYGFVSWGRCSLLRQGRRDARRLHDQLLTYLGDGQPVHLLPEPEVLPFERLAVDAHTGNQRLAALASMGASKGPTGGDGAQYPLVVTSIGAALRKTLPPEVMRGANADDGDLYRVSVGQRVRLSRLLTRWVELGYRNEPLVESPGCFSHRGGIIDVYPPHSDLPYRIELFDDEVDTIRLFDPYTQRSVRSVDVAALIPAREQLPELTDRSTVERLAAAMDFTKCSEEARERMEDEIAHLFSAPNIETLSLYNGLLNSANPLEHLAEGGLVVLERGEPD